MNIIESLKVDFLAKYNSESITNNFNDFFSSVGEKYANKLKSNPNDLNQYLEFMTRSSKTLFLRPTTRQELIQLIHKLPDKSRVALTKCQTYFSNILQMK